jgi:hypothetical protein
MSKIKTIPNESLNNANGGWGRFGGGFGGWGGGGYGALARAAEWNAIGSAVASPYYGYPPPAPYPYWR